MSHVSPLKLGGLSSQVFKFFYSYYLLHMFHIPQYLVLLHFLRCWSSQMLHFHNLKICGNSTLKKSICIIFPRAFVHFVSLCHILVIQHFKLFHHFLFVTVIYDQRSLT